MNHVFFLSFSAFAWDIWSACIRVAHMFWAFHGNTTLLSEHAVVMKWMPFKLPTNVFISGEISGDGYSAITSMNLCYHKEIKCHCV